MLACALAGCAVPVDRAPLPLQATPEFSSVEGIVAPDRWWRAFGDDALDRRVDRALTGNFSLAAAWQRLEAARALARREGADLAPALDGTAEATVRDGSDVRERTEIGVGLEASWEVDLWGRIRAAVEAERLRAEATAADYRAGAITLSAEVALAWYRFAEARQQLDLIAEQIETNRKVLRVLEQRFAVGQSGSADVLRQRQLVEATREQAIVARTRLDVLEHELAVLEGRPPQAIEMPSVARLPDLRPLPATGLPADLIRRRPDVRAAFLRLEAADAEVAAAVADQYPRLDLAGVLSSTAENPSGLFDAWLASLASRLVAPLYDAGRRRAEVERTAAERRRLLAEYGTTVLEAFREVEDALAREARQIARIRSLREQITLAETTNRQLRSQYLNGAADFIDVLVALRELQELRRSLLQAELERVTFRIALHRALAGGFPTPREAARIDGVGEEDRS